MGWSPALGLIETRGLVGSIEAADAAAKAAEVEELRLERVTGGLVCIHFVGETAAVQAAVEAGAAAAARVGELVSSHVIPRMDDETAVMLRRGRDGADPSSRGPAAVPGAPGPTAGPTPGSATSDARTIYEAMLLKDLRKLARATPGFSIRGRTVQHTSKERIIDELLRLQGQEGGAGNA